MLDYSDDVKGIIIGADDVWKWQVFYDGRAQMHADAATAGAHVTRRGLDFLQRRNGCVGGQHRMGYRGSGGNIRKSRYSDDKLVPRTRG